MKPSGVLLFVATCLIALGGLCLVLPHRVEAGSRTLRWPTLAEVFDIGQGTDEGQTEDEGQGPTDSPEDTEAVALPDSVQDTVATPQRPVIPKVQVDSTTDSRIFLQSFYTALSETDTRRVRVLHYGDSQIEEDRMTTQIRQQLQDRYGGRGIGLMPLAQTIPSRSVQQQLYMNGRLIQPQQGLVRYLVYGPKRDQRSDGLYGVMGQVAEMNDSLVSGSETLMTVCTPLDGRPRYTTVRVFADSTISYTRSRDTLRLNGRGKVYGLSQESETGVIVDNIPMRGCLGLVFNKIDSAQLAQFCTEENVRLIILQFGGNAIPFNETPSTIYSIVKGLRKQVQYIRQCAPEASILFIGPSDMIRQTEGAWETYPMVPYMDRLLHKMALEENIAYFSLYRWMGGAGSMTHWQEVGLAGKDGIHFTRAGAQKAGKAIAGWLLENAPSDNEQPASSDEQPAISNEPSDISDEP